MSTAFPKTKMRWHDWEKAAFPTNLKSTPYTVF